MNLSLKTVSIRTKVVFVVFVYIFFLVLCVYTISTLIISKSYLSIEKEDAVENIERVDDVIKNTASELRLKLVDWAFWDDTYEFMGDKNEAYIKSNLKNVSISNLKINAMVFVDTKGEIVFKKMIDHETLEDMSSESIGAYVLSHENLTQYESPEKSVSGVILLPEGPFIVSSSPILTSNADGSPRGSLIFGKFLKDTLVQSLEKLTHISFALYEFNSTTLPADVLKAKSLLLGKETHVIDQTFKNKVVGYKIINDINGDSALLLRIESDRKLYNQGRFTIYFFIGLTALFIIFFGIALMFFLERFVISRLLTLGTEVDKIDPNGDVLSKVKEGSYDEIGRLAEKINTMLRALDSSKKVEKHAMDNMRLVGAELASRLEEIEKTNGLMVGRELKMIELKKEIEALKLKQ